MFRDPRTWRWYTDHMEYFHQLGADTLAHFARIVKEEAGGRSLVVAFNGYLPDLGVNQEIDHRAFDRTVRNRDVDVFSSPHSYWRRKPGEDAIFRGFLGSVRAMGKLWIDEADERTSIASPSQWKHVSTIDESVEVLWRAFAQALTQNCGLWFMDQGGMWYLSRERGWYQHKAILDAFDRMHTIAEESMARPRTRACEVAVVASFRTAPYLADRAAGIDQVTQPLITAQIEQLTKCGAPFDLYLISELFEPTVPDYRMYVFLDTFFMSDAELQSVQALRDAGKHMLFFHAPGFVSEDGLSVRRMSELLRMDIETTDWMRLPTGWIQRPGFRVVGRRDEVARFGNVLYCPAPPLPASALRQLLRDAGVHVYLDTDDPLMVGGGYVALHTAAEGRKLIRNPAPASWVNARTGKALAEHSAEIAVDAARGETLLLEVRQPL